MSGSTRTGSDGVAARGTGGRKFYREGVTSILEEDVLIFIFPEDYLFSRVVRNADTLCWAGMLSTVEVDFRPLFISVALLRLGCPLVRPSATFSSQGGERKVPDSIPLSRLAGSSRAE